MENNFFLKAGTYIVTGCPADNPNTNYAIIVGRTKNGSWNFIGRDIGQGLTFTIEKADEKCPMYITCEINNAGVTVNNLVFKPMLRKADIDDSTYRPYNPQAIQNQLNNQTGVLGAKNLIRYPYYNGDSYTDGGITYIVNEDQSITVNGHADTNSTYRLITRFTEDYFLKSGRYIVSGAKDDVYMTVARTKNGDYNSIAIFASGEREFAIAKADETCPMMVTLEVASGTTINNVTIYPMLRLASDPDDTYVPYAMTNMELTEHTQIKDITPTIANQTHYTFTDFTVQLFGKICVCNIVAQSVDIESQPSGQSWTVIANNLPRMRKTIDVTVPASDPTKYPMQATIPNNGSISFRGGSVGQTYRFSLTCVTN